MSFRIKNISLYIALLSLPFLSASSCDKKDKNKTCGPNVMCTMLFASIGVAVNDVNGNTVTLDETETIRKSTGEVIKYDQSSAEPGNYWIITDSYVQSLQNQTDSFEFIGKKDGKIVVDEPFVISADCCHVDKVSGKEVIIIP